MASITINLTADFYMPSWRSLEEPTLRDFTFSNLVANTPFGVKLDKLRQLLYHYHDEALKEEANLNGFSYSAQAKKMVTFINTVMEAYKEYSQKAIRPKYSVLDNSKIINTFMINQVNYLNSLKRCIKIIKNES